MAYIPWYKSDIISQSIFAQENRIHYSIKWKASPNKQTKKRNKALLHPVFKGRHLNQPLSAHKASGKI